MPHVERSILVHYSAEQMFHLVADVQSYPQFLPWCGGADIAAGDDRDLIAWIDIDYHGLRSRFSTRNRLSYPHELRMSLIDGPFRSLEGVWHFRPLTADACKVQLTMHYEFASGVLGRAVGLVFDAIASSMIDSFAQRADALYGAERRQAG